MKPTDMENRGPEMPTGLQYDPRPATIVRSVNVKLKLENLMRDGIIDEGNLRGKVLDIGVGYGGSYHALTAYSDDVTGTETMPEIADMLIALGIVPEDRLVRTTASDPLAGMPSEQFDLVVIAHLFDDSYGFPIAELHDYVVDLLKPGGQLIVTAERDDLSASRYFLDLAKLFERNMGTAQLIPNYQIGPDNFIYVYTK